MSDDSRLNSTQYLLGEISAKLGGIDSSLNRITFRLDNMETRVEKLEHADVKSTPWTDLVQKAVWAVMAVVGVIALRAVGVV